MTFLYLVHRLPYPPDRGDRIRSWRLLRFLAEHGQVDLACLADEPVSADQRQALDRLCRRVAIAPVGRFRRWGHAARSLAGGRSASEGLFYSRRLRQTVAAWSNEARYDRVIAFCSSMRPYLDLPGLASVPMLVDLVDVDSQKWFDYAANTHGPRRRLFQLEGRRVRQLETDLARRAEALVVVSRPEAELLRRFAPAAKVYPIANGVDLDYFNPDGKVESRKSKVRSQESGVRSQESEDPSPKTQDPSLLFIGALDYRANIDGITWFCREVWPRVRAKYPRAIVTLVGRNPLPAVQDLASLPGVELVGQVPDVRPYMTSAMVAIAPLRVARGIQNKVLEAAAMRMSVISSGPALEGLDFLPGEHLLRADTPDEWLASITHLFDNPHERARLAAAARAFVVAHHTWSARLAPLAALLESSRHTPCAAAAPLADAPLTDALRGAA